MSTLLINDHPAYRELQDRVASLEPEQLCVLILAAGHALDVPEVVSQLSADTSIPELDLLSISDRTVWPGAPTVGLYALAAAATGASPQTPSPAEPFLSTSAILLCLATVILIATGTVLPELKAPAYSMKIMAAVGMAFALAGLLAWYRDREGGPST